MTTKGFRPTLKLKGQHTQCPTCALGFNSTYAFDKHRYGKYTLDPSTRKCLTETQLVSSGWSVNPSGYWRTKSKGRVLPVRLGHKA